MGEFSGSNIQEYKIDEGSGMEATRKVGWDVVDLEISGFVTLNGGRVHDVDDAIKALKQIRADQKKLANDKSVYTDRRGNQRRK